MRLILGLFFAASLCLSAIAQQFPGFPPGVFQNRAAVDPPYVAPTSMSSPYLILNTTGPSTSANSYAPITVLTSTGFNTSSIPLTQSPWASAGYFSNLTVWNPNGVLSGGTIVVGISVSSSITAVTTVLSCTLNTSVSNCSAAGGSGITVTAGQFVDITAVPSSASGTTSNLEVSFEYTDTTGVHQVLCGGNQLMSTAPQNVYTGVGGQTGFSATELSVSTAIPTGGKIDNLYVAADTNPGGDSITVTGYAGGAVGGTSSPTGGSAAGTPGTLQVAMTGGATTGHDTTNSISFSAPSGSPPVANTFSLNVVTVTVRPRLNVCVRWTPSIAGQAIVLQSSPAGATGTTHYGQISGSANNVTSDPYEVSPMTMSIDDAFIALSTPPGGTATRNLQLRYGATFIPPGNVSGFTCSVASANYGCAPGQSYNSISQTDLLDWQMGVTGSPATVTWFKMSAVVCAGTSTC